MANDRADRFTLSSAAGLKVVRAQAATVLAEIQEARSATSALVRVRVPKAARTTGTHGRAHAPASRSATASKDKKWHVVDVEGVTLGRAAAIIANVLRGKHKPSFTPHIDCGDNVVVINADKIRLGGKKLGPTVFYRHSGLAPGFKQLHPGRSTGGRPERILEKAVERMIPRGPLGRQQLRGLRIFPGPEHPYGSEEPTYPNIASADGKRKG